MTTFIETKIRYIPNTPNRYLDICDKNTCMEYRSVRVAFDAERPLGIDILDAAEDVLAGNGYCTRRRVTERSPTARPGPGQVTREAVEVYRSRVALRRPITHEPEPCIRVEADRWAPYEEIELEVAVDEAYSDAVQRVEDVTGAVGPA